MSFSSDPPTHTHTVDALFLINSLWKWHPIPLHMPPHKHESGMQCATFYWGHIKIESFLKGMRLLKPIWKPDWRRERQTTFWEYCSQVSACTSIFSKITKSHFPGAYENEAWRSNMYPMFWMIWQELKPCFVEFWFLMCTDTTHHTIVHSPWTQASQE